MTVEDTIYIDAPPGIVWAVTEEVERWPEWTPTVSSVRRLDGDPFGVGSKARIKQPGQPETEWTVTEFVPEERFTWQTARTSLHMRATHKLEAEGDGTSNSLQVEASGFLAKLLSPLLRPLVRRALSEENRGLRARCEEMGSSAPNS